MRDHDAETGDHDGPLPALNTYLPKLNAFKDREARSFTFCLILRNIGSAPAEDIDVVLTFPTEAGYHEGSLRFFSGEDGLQAPEPPEPPRFPSNRLFNVRSEMHGLIPSMPQEFRIPNVTSRIVDHVPPVQWRCHVKRLKHGDDEILASVGIRFISWEVVRPFHIGFEIAAANRPDRQSGQVHLVVSEELAEDGS